MELLTIHLKEFGTAKDGRLFPGKYGGPLSEGVYGRIWQKARQQALTEAETASPLAARPYDLRHACVTTWHNVGVDPAQVAEWAGQSVAVLLRVYVRCIAGRDEIAKKRIERAFDEELRTNLANLAAGRSIETSAVAASSAIRGWLARTCRPTCSVGPRRSTSGACRSIVADVAAMTSDAVWPTSLGLSCQSRSQASKASTGLRSSKYSGTPSPFAAARGWHSLAAVRTSSAKAASRTPHGSGRGDAGARSESVPAEHGLDDHRIGRRTLSVNLTEP